MNQIDEIIEANLSTIEDINKLADSCGWYPVCREFNPMAYTLELFFKPCGKNHEYSDKFSKRLLDVFDYPVRIYFQSKCISILIDL